MAISLTPGSATDIGRTIGRVLLFRSDYWVSEDTNLTLSPLGDVEGSFTLNDNETIGELVLDELGGALVDAAVDGVKPTGTVNLYLADPALRPILTPTGTSGGAGYPTRKTVKYHTLAAIPEGVFLKTDGTIGALSYTPGGGGGWQVGGVAMTTEQTRLFALSVFMWKVFFLKPPITMAHANMGKAVDQVQFRVVQDFTKPAGQQLYTRGDPTAVAIDVHPDVTP